MADEFTLARHGHLGDPAHRPPPLLKPVDELARLQHQAPDYLALPGREPGRHDLLKRRADGQPEAVTLDQVDGEPVAGLADRDVRHQRGRGRPGRQPQAGTRVQPGPDEGAGRRDIGPAHA